MGMRLTINFIYLWLSFAGLVAAAFSFLIHPNDPKYQLLCLGFLSIPATVALPAIMSRRISMTDPINFFFLSVFVGTVLGCAYIGFGAGIQREWIMGPWTVEDHVYGAFWVLISLMCISGGYCFCPHRIRLEKIIPKGNKLNQIGIQFGLIVGIGISLLFIVSYIQNTGGFDFLTISRKRSLEIEVDGTIVHGAGGYLMLLASVSEYTLYILLGFYLSFKRKIPGFIKLQLIVLLLISMIVPFISSSRGALIYTIIGIFYVFCAFRKINVIPVIISSLGLLVIFGWMTTLRFESQRADSENYGIPLLRLAQSGNGMSVAGTTAVLHGVPERMEYQLGSTLFTWITAPIPRSVWPGKPEISLGKRVKEELYHMRVLRTGRPVSLMAEGYMNFGWVGFISFSFFVGYLLRFVANTFEGIMSKSPIMPVLYFSTVMAVAGFANSNLSQSIVRYLTSLITLFIAYQLMTMISSLRKA